MFHRIDTVLIPFSNCGRRGWEISKYHLAFNQNSDKNEKNWEIIYWKNFSQSLYDPSLFILTLTNQICNQSRVHLQMEQQKSVMCFCGFFWSKSRFGDTKSRIKPNQTLSIKLKTLNVIVIVKKFLVESSLWKIMYQLFMKALWFLATIAANYLLLKAIW